MEFVREEISTKFDEANQTIEAQSFENNFLTEKTKKLEAEFSKLELSWKGRQALSSMRCLVFKNLLLIELV